MRLAFLELPLAERSLYFQQAALQRGLHPAIMEKDFWDRSAPSGLSWDPSVGSRGIGGRLPGLAM